MAHAADQTRSTLVAYETCVVVVVMMMIIIIFITISNSIMAHEDINARECWTNRNYVHVCTDGTASPELSSSIYVIFSRREDYMRQMLIM